MRSRTVSAILVLILVIPGRVFANHVHPHEFHSFEDAYFEKVEFLMRHEKELALTDQQIQTIRDKKFEIKRQMIQSEAQIELAMLDVLKQLHNDVPDMDKIDTLIDNKIEVKRTLAKSLAQALVGMKNILTPEQKAKSKEIFWVELARHAHSHHHERSH